MGSQAENTTLWNVYMKSSGGEKKFIFKVKCIIYYGQVLSYMASHVVIIDSENSNYFHGQALPIILAPTLKTLQGR